MDLGARRGVAQGVLQQVDDQSVQLVANPLHLRRMDLQGDLVLAGHGAELGRGLDGDLAQIDLFARTLAGGIGTREQQQVGDQPAHPLRGAQGRGRGLALLAAQGLGQQLEVGEDARQRRTQLVRGVGHETPLAGEHGLGLPAGGVELAEHPLERSSQLGDLVVGLRFGNPRRRIACSRDLRGRARERRDRSHRPPRDHQPGHQRQATADEHPEHEQQLDPVDRRLSRRQRPRVLDDQMPDRFAGRGHVDFHRAADRRGSR